MGRRITSLSVTEIDAEVKRWGNSLGIRVPAALAHEQGIAPGDVVRVSIEKFTRPAPEAFGAGRAHAKAYGLLLRSRKQEVLRRERERERRLAGR